MLLGTPIDIRGTVLRNRIVSAPMERNYCALDGTPTPRYAAYLTARAAGGAALVFTEAAYVRAEGRGRARGLGVHGDHVVPELRMLADAVHAPGALIGVELNHAGRVASAAVSGRQPVAPSPVPWRGQQPRELSTGEIAMIVEAYADAAWRCVRAGVDVLEIHAAHGYLIAQFLSPRTNQRADDYADPVRFANEVITAVRDAAPHTPLFLAGGHAVVLIGAQSELAPEAGPREKGPAMRRVLSHPAASVRLRSTVEAVEPDRVLVGCGGERTWLAATGPFLLSQGTVPRVPDLGSRPWETHTVGEADFADSAAAAIRQAARTAAGIG